MNVMNLGAYEAPQVEIIEVAVEQGFAVSILTAKPCSTATSMISTCGAS